MQRKSIITSMILLVILAAVLLLVFGWQYWRKESASDFAKANLGDITDVHVGTVKSATWYPEIHSIGSIIAVQGIDVSAPIDGTVSKVFFTSGDIVAEGHPLVQFDDATYQADVARDLASYNLKKLAYARQQQLMKVNATAQSLVDEAKAEMEEALAVLKNSQALLNQTLVKAPFAGRLGLRQASTGQYVKAGVALVSLQQVDPIDVDFQLPEVYVDDVKKGFDVKIENAAYPGKIFNGKVKATNAILNQATRTLNVRAQISNPDGLLIPGMFAEVTVVIPTPENVMLVPVMAINYSPFGDTVFKVVNNHAKQIYIKAGEQRDGLVAIKGEIKTGDNIVTVGAFKLQNGEAIRAVPEKVVPLLAPKTLHKKPADKIEQVKSQVNAFSQSKNKQPSDTGLTKDKS